MEHEPRGLLADPKLAVQFHAGDALEVGREEVYADGPHAVGQLAALHDGALAQREEAAVAAAMGHRLVVGVGVHVERAALRAVRAIRPALVLDPLPGLVLVVEHGRDIEQR